MNLLELLTHDRRAGKGEGGGASIRFNMCKPDTLHWRSDTFGFF